MLRLKSRLQSWIPGANQYLKIIDQFISPLVWYSIFTLLVELSSGSENSLEGHSFFLWSERTIASIFTLELFFRWLRGDYAPNEYGKTRIGSFFWIDLISIAPFWLGFLSVVQLHLSLIRSLRVLRLLKFLRYSRSLQLVALGFYRAWPSLKPLMFSALIIIGVCSVGVFESERFSQPEGFSSLWDAFWFTMVTVTTVGYGDRSPVTISGQSLCIMTFFVGLAVFGAVLGVLQSSFSEIIEQERDPSIDPLEEFREMQARRHIRNMLRHHTRDTEPHQTIHEGLASFAEQIQSSIRDQLVSLVAYGNVARGDEIDVRLNMVNVLVVLKQVSIDTLDQISPFVIGAQKKFGLTVMIVTETELRTSLDVFPVKLLDMKRNHFLLAGEDLLSNLEISKAHLRLRCEQQMRNLSLKLNSFYLHGSSKPEEMRQILEVTGNAFIENLRGYLYLLNDDAPLRETDVAKKAALEIGFDSQTVEKILDLKQPTKNASHEELRRLFGLFMECVTRSANVIDAH